MWGESETKARVGENEKGGPAVQNSAASEGTWGRRVQEAAGADEIPAVDELIALPVNSGGGKCCVALVYKYIIVVYILLYKSFSFIMDVQSSFLLLWNNQIKEVYLCWLEYLTFIFKSVLAVIS